MTVPAFFQVLFLMMLQFAEERNGPEEENEEHASFFLPLSDLLSFEVFLLVQTGKRSFSLVLTCNGTAAMSLFPFVGAFLQEAL